MIVNDYEITVSHLDEERTVILSLATSSCRTLATLWTAFPFLGCNTQLPSLCMFLPGRLTVYHEPFHFVKQTSLLHVLSLKC